ncbi:carbohydrate porin [Piscinibacter sp. XHJ-5]|uniref:maltoporin n=1 Tax=Piscinibacter sp. XHJ-5 TaxID=3037797 RepID=UPI002452AB47|nr:carbohydrate porin [Piscinibacter sp. XHJ-5]
MQAARRFDIAPIVIAAALVALAAPVRAVDLSLEKLGLEKVSLESRGYLRAGPGLTSRSDHHACYQLPGADFKYRLGNECDLYGEFLFTVAPKDHQGGPGLKLNYMPTVFDGTGDHDQRYKTAQFYVEGSGFGFAPEASFWIGKRFHRGADVHIVDTYFEKLDGDGAGASLPLLGGKLDLAYYHNGPRDAAPAGHRLNAWLRDIPVNTGGTLNVLAGLTRGEGSNGKAGASLSVRHHQKLGETSDNNVWFQVAQGSGGLDGNFGDLTAGSDVKRWRLVDGYQFQLTPRFGGQAIAMIGQRESDAGKETVTSLGGRVAYAFTRHFKVLGEVGIDRVKPEGGPARNLTKLTIAPTWSKGEAFGARPELRLFVTHASWNQAADAAAGAGGLAGLRDGKTSGTSVGLQLETWW